MESLPFSRKRFHSIDILRGAIMVIMALDHVRDFFHDKAILEDPTNLTSTTPALFFTRWITHFCAPVFVFLSGLSAYIGGLHKTKKELSYLLITRGIWLLLVEILVMSLILTFNPTYNLILLLVLWAIGWSMIILGLLVRTSYSTIAIVAMILFFGHNLTDLFRIPTEGAAAAWWNILLTTSGSFYPLSTTHFVAVTYAILPWTGIMLFGYLIGALYGKQYDPKRRRKILFVTGAFLLSLFLVLRFSNGYGDPSPWNQQKTSLFTFLSFINTTKYPVSLLFACMTLGPALMVLSQMENGENKISRFVRVYGKVPFFFYIGHFLLVHMLCVIAFFVSGRSVNEISDPRSPFLFRPADFGYPLWGTYLIWLIVILLMYYPCRWYGRYKETHRKWWLSYL